MAHIARRPARAARLLASLAALALLAAALAGTARADDPPPETDVQLYVWQSVASPLRHWISARPDDQSRWRTAELDMAIIEGGGWRAGGLTVTGRDGGRIELRLWQNPAARGELHLSARPASASWSEYGTQPVELDRTSRNGRYRYARLEVGLGWPDAAPPLPGEEREALCVPEELATESIEARVWRSVASPGRYWIGSRTAAAPRWTIREVAFAPHAPPEDAAPEDAPEDAAGGESGEAPWSVGGLTVAAGDASFELVLWSRGAETQLSARVAGMTWDEHGTRPLELDRTTSSGRFTYAHIDALTLTLPEAEPPLPGEEAATWACPEPTPTPTPTATPASGFVGGFPGGQQPGGTPPTSPGTLDPNNAPPKAHAGPNQIVSPGATVTLDGSRSFDPERESPGLSYSWVRRAGAAGGTYDGNTSISPASEVRPRFTMPADAEPGETLIFKLTVTDPSGAKNTNTDTNTVKITTNTPPTASAGDDQTVGVGSTVQLNGSSSDPDPNDTSNFSWAQDTTTTDPNYYTTAITLTGASTSTLSFEVPSAARDLKIKFTLTVTDSHNQTGTDDVEVTVTANQPPATPSPSASPTSGKPGTSVTLTADEVDDPDSGDTVSYAWTKDGSSTYAGTITFDDDDARNTSFTVPSDATKGQTIVLRLTASDNQTPSAKSHDTVTFTAAAELTTSNVTARTATLNLAGWSGNAWWYKSATAGQTTCTSAGTGASADVTGLTPGTAYVFTAYGNSACTTALDAAPSFTTPAELTVSGVTTTGATLNLVGHSGNWYYKSTTTGQKTCTGPVSTATKTLTGLDEGTSYTYSAYSDSTCTTANLLATATTFRTGVSLAASGVTATGATLTIAGHTAQWWYKADTGPHSDCQGPVAANTATKALTGLSPGTSYVYRAYSASGCAGATALATAPSFTTLAQLTTSNLTARGATLNLAGHSGDWYYKANKTPHNSCSSVVSAGTSAKAITGLAPNTSYIYTAYSDSNCSTANALDEAPSFTTPVEFTAGTPTATTVTLTIAGHSAQWWYKSTTTGHTTCTGPVPAGATSATRTGLTPGTAYIFTAYSNSACTTVLDSAPSFTTTHAPTVTFPDANVTAGNTATLSVTAGHTGSGTISSYAWSVTGKSAGAPDASLTSTTTTTATTGLVVPSGAWKAAPHHTYTVKVRATDSAGEWTEASATLTVNNRAPVAVARASKAYALQTQRVDLGGQSSTDPDNDSHLNWIYSWAKTGGSYTKAITINNATYGSAWFTVPSDASTGDTIIITLTLGDGKGGTDTDNVTITVGSAPQQPNNPPVANPGASNQSFEMTPVNKNNPTVSLDGSGSSDPDGDTLYYNWSKYGGTCTTSITLTNPNSAKPTFQWPSGCAVDTSVGLRLTVYDRVGVGGLSDTEDIRVWRQNGAPTVTVNNGAAVTAWKHTDTTATSSATVTAVISDDPDGDTLTYQWLVQKDGWSGTKPCPPPDQSKQCVDTTAPPPGISVSGTTTKTLTMTLANAAATGSDYTVNLIVKDSHGAVLTPSVGLTIANNTAPGTPTLNPTSLYATRNTSHNLSASANDSDTGQTLSYEWIVPAGTCSTYISLSSTNTDSTTLTVSPTLTTNLTCNLKARATDGYGGESEATLVVNLSP